MQKNNKQHTIMNTQDINLTLITHNTTGTAQADTQMMNNNIEILFRRQP